MIIFKVRDIIRDIGQNLIKGSRWRIIPQRKEMIKEGYTRDQIIVSTNSHTFMGKGGFHIPINNLIQSRALGPFAVILSHEGSVLILKTPE